MTDVQIKALTKLVKSLDRHSIKYYILGGLAAIAYGSTRELNDIDVKVSEKDIPTLEKLFSANIIRPFAHSPGSYFNIFFMIIELDGVSIDISQAENFFVGNGAGKLQQIDSNLDKSTKVTLNGVDLNVVPKEELVAYKNFLDRPVDRADVSAIS